MILRKKLILLMVKKIKYKEKFLITGGCGFIGSCLVRFLLKNDEQVINIDKLTYSANIRAVGNTAKNNNYQFFKADICNHQKIKNIINETNPTKIIHLAAETHVDRSIDGPSKFIDTNIGGTHNLLSASVEYFMSLGEEEKNNFKVILVSTDEVYGSLELNSKKFDENSPYKPNSPYSATKAAADHLGRAWFKTFNLPIIITNTTNNYGPWQFPEKLIPLTISKCLDEKKIPVYGKGKQIRDWIHVDDHVNGILKVLEKGNIGEKYNIGSNNELRNIDVVMSICKIFNDIKPRDKKKNYEDLIEYVEDRPGHDFRYALDNKKIKAIGWKPNNDWLSGLKSTIKWYLDNIEYLKIDSSQSYSGERLGKNK